MFGTKQSFAPLDGSRPDGDDLQLAVTKDMVQDAPGVEDDGHIEDSENENVTQTVPVSHDEVRLKREPVTDVNTR